MDWIAALIHDLNRFSVVFIDVGWRRVVAKSSNWSAHNLNLNLTVLGLRASFMCGLDCAALIHDLNKFSAVFIDVGGAKRQRSDLDFAQG